MHGDWFIVSLEGETRIEAPGPVPSFLSPELERIQDAFVREWLSYSDEDARAAQALRARELPARGVNLRPTNLPRLATGAPVRTISTPGADLKLITFLGGRWMLDYAPQ